MKFKIGPDGKPVYTSDVDAMAPASASTTPTGSTTPITSIAGNNMGVGHGVFAGANIGQVSVLDFRSLVGGIGISLQTDANSITITNTQSLPNLTSLPGVLGVSNGGTGVSTLTARGILVGDGSNPVQSIVSPVSANSFLAWNGSSFEWNAGTAGTAGPQGVAGLQGIQGVAGVDGVDGAVGPQGIQGLQGIQGEVGIQGIAGVNGVNGSDADNFAVIFNVGVVSTQHNHVARLTHQQAKDLMELVVTEVILSSSDVSGHTHDITVKYDQLSNSMYVSLITNNATDNHTSGPLNKGTLFVPGTNLELVAGALNVVGFATVATSGSYNDLMDKPAVAGAVQFTHWEVYNNDYQMSAIDSVRITHKINSSPWADIDATHPAGAFTFMDNGPDKVLNGTNFMFTTNSTGLHMFEVNLSLRVTTEEPIPMSMYWETESFLQPKPARQDFFVAAPLPGAHNVHRSFTVLAFMNAGTSYIIKLENNSATGKLVEVNSDTGVKSVLLTKVELF